MNSIDSLFVFVCALLVFLMIPGLAFFYGGLVRKKNILSVLMACFATLAVVSLQWVAFGYSLSFGNSELLKGFLGGLEWVGLLHVGDAPFNGYSSTIPHRLFMMFQLMFAAITPALIIGAVAERMKFSAFLLFVLLWTTLVYDPIAHWVWSTEGWLRTLGSLDFAGGTVVHISSGFSALAAILILGKRKEAETAHPSNLPLVAVGAGLLWLGWFGFNAGSALGATAVAMQAFITTHISASAAALGYAGIEWFFQKKPTLLGTLTGAVAGLVAITPAAGFVGIGAAVFIGLLSSVISYVMIIYVKRKLGYDDALDVVGVHGMCGVWGALATGLFASKAINLAGADGLLAGNASLLLIQGLSVLVSAGYAFGVSYLILKLIDRILGLRVSPTDELKGLDLSEHNESAYKFLD